MPTCSHPSPRFHTAMLVRLALAGMLAFRSWPLLGQESSADAQPQQQYVAEAQRMWAEANELAAAQQWDAAIAAARNVLKIQRDHLGAEQPDTCQMLETIAAWQGCNSDLPGVLATYQELEPLSEKVYGRDDWRTVDVRLNAANIGRIATLTPEDQRRLGEATELDAQAQQLHAAGNDAAAVEKAQQALKIRVDLLGRDSPTLPPIMSAIGVYQLGLGAYDKARPLLQESADLHQRAFGAKHPQTLAAKNNLCMLYADTNDYSHAIGLLEEVLRDLRAVKGPEHPNTVEVLFNLGGVYMMAGRYSDAEPRLLSALQQMSALYGQEHPKTAKAKDCLGLMYTKKGDYQQALPYLTSSVDLFQRAVGEKHPDTAGALYDLGYLYEQLGNSAEAEKNFKRSLDIRSEALGDEHPDTAAALDDLARVYEARGDLGQAERLFRRALQIQLKTAGPDHIKTGRTLGCLGGIYLTMRDYGKAESYLQKAVAIYRRLLGDEHADTALGMQVLANVYKLQWRCEEAEQMYKQALTVSEKALGPDDPQTAHILNNLGNLYERQQKYAEAEPYYQRALGILKSLGQDNPRYAMTVSYLARISYFTGDLRQARQHSDSAIELLGKSIGPNHHELVDVLIIAGLVDLQTGDVVRAKTRFARALDIVQGQLDANAPMQPERQQLAVASEMRYALDMYLSLPGDPRSADEAYRHLLLWKGAIQARQMRDHRQRRDDVAPLAAELQRVCTRITTLSLKVPEVAERDAWFKQLAVLKDRRENLEAELAYHSRDYDAQRKTAAVTPEQVRSVLPPGTALVDVIDNARLTISTAQGRPVPRYLQQYVAFVVRPDRPTQRIELGPSQPINDAIEQWRKSRGFPTKDAAVHPAAAQLRQLVWQPLEPHLDGCRTVLLSPDSFLSRIPLGVLPGDQPGSFLVEDVAIATFPVPQMLPEMLTAPAAPGAAATSPALLLIGDVDYNAAAGRSAESDRQQSPKESLEGSDALSFGPLKSTGPEVHGLADRFQERFPDGKVTLLEKADASEDAFRRQAPQHTLLLLATHGFFAPPGIGSALAVQDRLHGAAEQSGFHCGTLSGLALAGANTRALPDGDDGILTASEVATLDLRNIDLAVLSGCETGLGQLAGGEGAVGLQRAFQVAGARTTIASLWTVPDQKTSQIMRRFYANLWDKRMSKLEALREAQVWMLRTGGKEIAADGPSGADSAASPGKRQPPYFWAAFQLSGDWR